MLDTTALDHLPESPLALSHDTPIESVNLLGTEYAQYPDDFIDDDFDDLWETMPWHKLPDDTIDIKD